MRLASGLFSRTDDSARLAKVRAARAVVLGLARNGPSVEDDPFPAARKQGSVLKCSQGQATKTGHGSCLNLDDKQFLQLSQYYEDITIFIIW